MIVVHVGEYVSGGLATYLQNLIAQQCEDPNISKVYFLYSEFDSQELTINSQKFIAIPYSYHRSIKGIFTILKLWKVIFKLHPDIVHLHSTFAGLLRASLPLGHKSTKIVYCAHGWAFLTPRSQILRFIYAFTERLLSHKTDAIINISKFEYIGAERIGIRQKKLFLVPNAITLKDIEPVPIKEISNILNRNNNKLKILYVGRFDKYKGMDILLSAFKRLEREAILILAGKAVLDTTIKIPKSSNVIDVGWRSGAEVSWLMRNVDVVVIPSRAEGFGLVAFEAFSNHTMVVSSNAGGLTELVIDGKTGRVFPTENTDKLVAILNNLNKDEMNQYVKQADKLVRFLGDAKDMERRIAEVYRSV